MRFRVLGPVEIEADDGQLHPLARRQERCVLAMLLLDPGRVLPVDRMCQLLWDDNPPRHARRAVHAHIAHIRAVLARAGSDAEVVSDRHGYLLRVDPDTVDAHRFRSLAEQATLTTDLGERDRLLREALALWRGPALHNVATSERLRQQLCAALDEQRLQAIEASVATGLELGRHRELLPELAKITAEHPVRERLAELHMRALHRNGSTAEALAVYRRIHAHLVDELGLDPGPGLQQLHRAILRGEPVPVPSAVPPRRPDVGGLPAQLPASLPAFAGRDAELNQLDSLLARLGPTSGPTPTVVISAVSGTAGVGKTTLAMHWSHRVRERFPDGQLYVNLRGFDPNGQVMAPADAIRGFLDALGVPPERVPPSLHAQAGLYRSLLSGKRVLVVLDNARDAEQVRPLLPGSAGCLVLVTSRNQLTSLVAADNAVPLTVDLLSAREARKLLALRLGADRVAAEPDAVDEITARCARLPLALAMVAARAQQTGFPLTALAAELNQAGARLDALDGGGPDSQIRTVFSWSYTALNPPAARLFRLLGLHPGPDISVAAAASLAARSAAEVRRPLADLTRANLLTEHVPGRYTFHDLLRAYASDLAHAEDPDEHRRAAVTRMLDHYTHTAYTADRLLDPARDPIHLPLAPPAPGSRPEPLTDQHTALTWLTTEYPVLTAVLRQAADAGLDEAAWQLAWALDTFLFRRGHWQDQAATWGIALTVAGRQADPVPRAEAHRGLARVDVRLGRHADADAHLQCAVALYAGAGHRVGQARAHHNLAILWGRWGHPDKAVAYGNQARALFRAAGDSRGEASALNGIGWHEASLGDYPQALAHCERALAILEQVGDRDGQASTWDSLGYIRHHLGHTTLAVECYQRSLDLFRDLGDRHTEAEALTRLGDAHWDSGQPDAARAAWSQALRILTELDHPGTDAVRARISAGPPAPRRGAAPRRHP